MVYTIENVKSAMRLYGLSPDDKIDEEILNQKKRELIKKYHPDRFPDPEEKKKAEEKAKEINSSYDILVWWGKEGQAEYIRAREYNYNNNPNYNRQSPNYGNYGTDFDDILREILAAFFGTSDQETRGSYNQNRNNTYRKTSYQSNSSTKKSFFSKLIDFVITFLVIVLFFRICS